MNWGRRKVRFGIKAAVDVICPDSRFSMDGCSSGSRGTSSSQEHCFLMERYGLDKHTASAYLIALRYVQDGKTMNNYKACKQPE